MNTKHRVPRRIFTIRTKPPIRFDRSEGRSMTASEKQIFLQMLVDRAFLPVLGGSVPIGEKKAQKVCLLMGVDDPEGVVDDGERWDAFHGFSLRQSEFQ